METNVTKRTDLFWIDPRNIDIVDGFNVRREFDLDELKEQIKANGVLNPVTVIPYKAGVVILSQECKACEFYAGECITQHIRCNHE